MPIINHDIKKIYHLSKIPVRFDRDEVVKKLYPRHAPKQISNLSNVLETAEELINAQAVYKFACIGGQDGKTIKIEDIKFKSRLLCELLHDKNSVVPYILTLEAALEKHARESNDLLHQYYFDILGNLALQKAEKYLKKILNDKHGLKNLSNLSPGSLKDWPIEEQKPFFSLFGKTEKLIGVTLTDKMLMIPAKSVSGIYFTSETEFIACRLCSRQNCQERRKPYSLSLT